MYFFSSTTQNRQTIRQALRPQDFLHTGSPFWILPHWTLSAKPKTAFVISGMSKYEFNRVPFGLAQAPAYFQKFINEVPTYCILPWDTSMTL